MDIIAREPGDASRENNAIHFFEVKSINVWSLSNIGSTRDFSGHNPEENVHSLKTRHIRRVVETYLADVACGNGRKVEDIAFQFHVLCVYMDSRTRRARVKWLRNIVL